MTLQIKYVTYFLNAFRLQRLDCFKPCAIQLGDKLHYVLHESDGLVNINNTARYTALHTVLHQNGLLSEIHSSQPSDGLATASVNGVDSLNGLATSVLVQSPSAVATDSQVVLV